MKKKTSKILLIALLVLALCGLVTGGVIAMCDEQPHSSEYSADDGWTDNY